MKHLSTQISAIALAALLALAGCNKKSENPPPTPPPAGSAAPLAAGSGSAAPAAAGSGSAEGSAAATGAAAGSGSAAAAVDVPTEQDFEDEAQAKITEKNIETEIGTLEKQLDPTKDPAK